MHVSLDAKRWTVIAAVHAPLCRACFCHSFARVFVTVSPGTKPRQCGRGTSRYYERVVELEATVSEARMLLERERQKTTSLTKELRRISDMCSLLPAIGLRSSLAHMCVVGRRRWKAMYAAKQSSHSERSVCLALPLLLRCKPVRSTPSTHAAA